MKLFRKRKRKHVILWIFSGNN